MKKMLFAVLLLAMVVPSLSFAADLASDATFKSKCAACHGPNGEGKAALKTVPLKDAAKMSEADLTTIIEKGKAPRMPAFGSKLKPEEIKTLVSEIKALK